MKKLIVSTLFLFFLFSSLIPAPIIPVQEVPQEHYGPVLVYACSAWLQKEQGEILEKGTGKYKDRKCTWVAYSSGKRKTRGGGKLQFLFSVSLSSAECLKLEKEAHWKIFANTPESFEKSLTATEIELREKLEELTGVLGRYLPWTLIATDFVGQKEIVELVVKITEKMGIFNELQAETPSPASPIEIKPLESK